MRVRIGTWAVETLPDLGARITSLSCPHGTEWLAASGRAWPVRQPRRWVDGDVRGWDECFPNIAGGAHPVTGMALADHGDLWNAPARCRVGPAGLTTSWSAPTVSARVTRDLVGEGDALRVDYTAVADRPLPVAWAMHLLLDDPPASVVLAPDVPVRIDSLFGAARRELAPGPAGAWQPWSTVRSHLLASHDDWAAKVFTRPGSTSEVQVTRGDEALVVSIRDAPVEPSFGLWFNAGALPDAPGVRHLGVEPSFGDHDDLAEAAASGSTLPLTTTPTRWSVLLDHTAPASRAT